MADKPISNQSTEKREGANVNAIGAGGQSADPFVGEVVSGQPAGGPLDLGEKAKKDRPAE